MANPNALAPNRVLATVNSFVVALGAPALASNNRLVTSTNMKVGSYTVANGGLSADGLPRNVTCTATAVGAADTPGTLTITGTNAAGATITEDLTPATGSTVAGTKAFATVTSVVGAGWVIGEGNDTIVVGFGNLIGLPASIDDGPKPFSAATEIFAAFLGGTAVAPVVTFDADEIEKCTIDASSGTYDGTKKLYALMIRA